MANIGLVVITRWHRRCDSCSKLFDNDASELLVPAIAGSNQHRIWKLVLQVIAYNVIKPMFRWLLPAIRSLSWAAVTNHFVARQLFIHGADWLDDFVRILGDIPSDVSHNVIANKLDGCVFRLDHVPLRSRHVVFNVPSGDALTQGIPHGFGIDLLNGPPTERDAKRTNQL